MKPVEGLVIIWAILALPVLVGVAAELWELRRVRRDRRYVLCERADRQHRQAIDDNPAGIYGNTETARLTNEIITGATQPATPTVWTPPVTYEQIRG